MPHDVDLIVHELTKGQPELFDRPQAVEARTQVLRLASAAPPDIDEQDALSTLSATDHVWNLVDKGRIFESLVQYPNADQLRNM